MEPRDFDDGDLRPLLSLAQELWRQEPTSLSCDFGQIAFWSANLVHAEHRVRLWYDGDELAGWGWVTRETELEWQVRPERPELLDEILDWAHPGEVLVRTDQADAIERLRAHGLRHDTDAPWMRLNQRTLERIDEPHVPRGYRVRTVEDGDFESRAAAHRSAFHPSRFRDDVYANVRASWPYRQDLDCVVEAPDGSIAAYALAWLDDANGVGELEPVGTHADHQRLGLGRAVNLFALQRLREEGATVALVACRGDDAHPIPRRLYESVGFREAVRMLPYRRP
jgi:ribosomal protein S18 acetylase RimI-like enzyme